MTEWMRPLATAAAACALCGALAAPTAAPAARPKSWAKAAIKVVTARGILAGSPRDFRADDPLTAGDLASLVSGVTEKDAAEPLDPSATVTITQLDATLVRALGLADAARRFQDGAVAAGLDPPKRFGTETVARLLGLRYNHPAGQDEDELEPTDVATRAEAAYSAAKIVGFGGWEVPSVREQASRFELPALSEWQQIVLQTAVSLIGYPYVWAGVSEHDDEQPSTTTPRGGFDCSGFVWRVFKLQDYGAHDLAATLRGRSTYTMSAEEPKRFRIRLADLKPADVLFFGAHGPRSKPGEIDHAGIYLGNGWFIHSSSQGVALASLASPWYRTGFAWGRRPLAEAGLVPPADV